MKTTTSNKLIEAIKNAGLVRSDKSTGSRAAKGWSSYIVEGVEISDVYPWRTQYVRKGRRFYHYVEDSAQEVRVSWTTFHGMGSKTTTQEVESKKNAPANFKKVCEALDAAGIEYEADEENYTATVMVANPYEGKAADMNRKQEALRAI